MPNDKGKGNFPRDDRTLLDPLSHDELKALREARQRMQAKKAAQGGSSAIKHQLVVGTDPAPEPPSKKSALPSFEGGNVTLDKIAVPKTGDVPQADVEETLVPSASAPADSRGPAAGERAPPGPQMSSQGAPKAGQTGFGENTLLWMQPVKPPPQAVSTAPTAEDFGPTPSRTGSRLMAAALSLVALLGIGAAVYFLWPPTRGTLELHTSPPGAALYLEGELQPQRTPLRLNLDVGAYQLRLEKDGFEPNTFQVRIEEGQARRDVDLVPVSKPGLITVGIQVTPIAGTVTLDDQVHESVRSVQVPNLDPKEAHTIRVEAPGYVKTERMVPPGELSSSYTFELQPIRE